MKLTERLMAAWNGVTGRLPKGDATTTPYFWNFTAGMIGTSTQNTKINHAMLRTFSETPITRRAIDYVRNQVARLEWDVLTLPGAKPTREQKRSIAALKNVLTYPNAEDNLSTLLGQLIEDMLVIGQAVVEVKTWPGHSERPILLYPVDAASVSIYTEWDGSPSKPRYAQFDMQGRRIDFTASEMLLMKHNPRSNTPFGLSPVEVAIQQIQYLLDAQAYAGKTASNATPKKLLWLGREVTQQQRKEFERYFRDEIEGRSHLPFTSGHDKPESIELGLAGDQALFLQWQSFLIAIIANAFNIDAMKFNAFVGINRSTGDTLDDSTDETAIRPMAQQIEHYINQYFVANFGIGDVAQFKFRFTTSYQDRKALATVHQIELQADKITINEARRESGLPDLPFDPLIGRSKGDLTLSEYRAIYGGFVSLQDAVGVDADTDSTNATSVEGRMKIEQAKQQARPITSATGKKDPANGVNSAAAPKDKAFNQRTDHATDVS